MSRDLLRQTFLAQNGFAQAACTFLAGDASFRKYYRLMQDDTPTVLMDAPPEDGEDTRPFIKIAQYLNGLGLSAPKIHAQDTENGFLILEDLGDQTYTNLLKSGHDERALYELACDALIALHQQADQLPENLKSYDAGLLNTEAELLPRWWMKAEFGEDHITEDLLASYRAAWQSAFDILQQQPQTLVLRDYHVDNLLLLDERDGVQACGLLDFQDAVAGPALYDLMSLMEDARRDIDPALIAHINARYLAAFPQMDAADFAQCFAILGAQRHAKVIGIFARLSMRDKKDLYLPHIPRVWRLLERSLEHPALKTVKDWIDTHIPTEKRGIPACLPK